MATVSVQSVSTAGTAITYSPASGGGDRYAAAEHTAMIIKNASGAPITATFVTPRTVDGLPIGDRAVSVPAGGERIVPVPDSLYRSSDGLADVTWSATPSVTFALIRL